MRPGAACGSPTLSGVWHMNKEMIISSGAHDTRVAILEDDQVVEIFIERENQRGVVGNIYKGRVSKVLPGMQSSFIDIGLERDAFLYVTEVINTVEEFEKLAGEDDDDEDGRKKKEEGTAEGAEGADAADAPLTRIAERRDRDRDRSGASAEARAQRREPGGVQGPPPKIEDLLKEGQEILVQVVKEPLG